MKTLTLAGDVVIDYLIFNGNITITPGGVANVQRCLRTLGVDSILTTIYNPSVFPLEFTNTLSSDCCLDVSYINTYVRNYDKRIFKRFRENMKPGVFQKIKCDVVTIHNESCIKGFETIFADIKSTEVKGKTKFLRLSSGDNYTEIMENVKFQKAIITYRDKIDVFNSRRFLFSLNFSTGDCLDEVGAGDVFFANFIFTLVTEDSFNSALEKGYRASQAKIRTVGVDIEGLPSLIL